MERNREIITKNLFNFFSFLEGVKKSVVNNNIDSSIKAPFRVLDRNSFFIPRVNRIIDVIEIFSLLTAMFFFSEIKNRERKINEMERSSRKIKEKI